ncbi:DUF2235 domain-containing protein [Marinivivus vitaminiproducens]|uniref:DUF2235 domain-containing protein n=1 Tax=Marinivivus vitaminiproducens TaxID=3035935 RepID=UPI0027A98BAE|nr:DUF2235 domain-containing protein [Geminicoccaceae bacterium SCSIO 64248]
MKRLIVCCDGTWNEPVDETNVIYGAAKAILCTNGEGVSKSAVAPKVEQIVYYDTGVGTKEKRRTWKESLSTWEAAKDLLTENDWVRMLLGGATGLGLSENVQEAYRFLAKHYDPGDEIYVFGFSRGAYTVRSLCGLISCAGLLKIRSELETYKLDPNTVDRLNEIYAYYRLDHHKRPSHPYHAVRETVARPVPVRFCGVYDTVGSLGVPIAPLAGLNTAHAFHDTSLCSCLAIGRQALAIDEERSPFEPTLWTGDLKSVELFDGSRPYGDRRQDVIQAWFPGVHSNVGGGYRDYPALSRNALRWLLREAEDAGLEIDEGLAGTVAYDARGRMAESVAGFWKVAMLTRLIRRTPRTIGSSLDPAVASKDRPVNEMLHWSARERMAASDAIGPAGGQGAWRPRSLFDANGQPHPHAAALPVCAAKPDGRRGSAGIAA